MRKFSFILTTALFAVLSVANIAAQDANVAANYAPQPYTTTQYTNTQAPAPVTNNGYQNGYQGSYQGGSYQGNYQGASQSGGYQNGGYQGGYYNQPQGAYNQPYGVYNGAYSPGMLAPPTPAQLNPGAAEADRLYNSYKYLPQ